MKWIIATVRLHAEGNLNIPLSKPKRKNENRNYLDLYEDMLRFLRMKKMEDAW